MADRTGQHFGNDHMVALLGQGGFAEVYLGQHVRLNLQAAIKMLHTHLTEQEVEHFQQEAETITTLMHPAIVRILDYDVQEGVPFLVMDYAAPYGVPIPGERGAAAADRLPGKAARRRLAIRMTTSSSIAMSSRRTW